MTAVSLHEAYLIGLAQSLGAILSIFITYPLQNLVTRFQIHSLLENNAAKEEQSIKEDLLLNQENLANEGKDNKKLVKKDPPLDSLKTIKPESQMPNREEAVHKLSDWEIFIKILQEEGISKLYTGLGVAMVGTGLQQGIFSFLHESLKSYYRSTVALNLPNFINFSYGMISGIITSTVINPILVISTRLNARQKLRLMQQQAQANAETLSPPTDLPATVRQSPTLEPNRRPNMAALIRIAPLIVPFCIDELPLSLVSPYSYFEEPNKCEDGQEFSLEHKCVVSYLRSIWDSILFSLREVHAVIQGVLKEGILTFWSGIFLAYILTINPAIQKSIFDYLTLLIYGREADGRIPTKEDLSYWNLFFISSTSKTAATITTYPLTLLKSRLYISIQSTQEEIKDKQASSLLASNQSVDPQESEKLNGNNLIVTKPLPTQQQGTTSRNMWTEFLEVLKTDGPAGLYRGLFSKIIQNCIMSVLNDFFSKSILRKLKILYPFAEADDHDLESEDLSSASGSIKKSQERPRKGSYKDFNGRGKHGFLRRSHGAVMPEEFSERPEDILEKSVVYRKNQQHLLRSALGSL